MNLPGLPWLAIEKNPEDYYDPSLLGVSLKMPDTMTHGELVKMVEHLAISPDSDNYFCFFSKDVIERNIEVRTVNEEEERRAGEEIHAGVDADEMVIDASNDISSPMVVDTVTPAETSCTSSNDSTWVMASTTAATVNAVDSSSPMIGDTVTPAEFPGTSNDLSLAMASTTVATVTADSSDTLSSLMVVNAATQEFQPSLFADHTLTAAEFSHTWLGDLSLVIDSATAPTVVEPQPSDSLSNDSSSIVINTITAQNATTTMPSSHTIDHVPWSSPDEAGCEVVSGAKEQAIHNSSSNDSAVYWANFERWLVNDLKGGEGWGPEITMSDVNQVKVWEGIDAKLFDNQSLSVSFASQPLADRPFVSYESFPSISHQQSLPSIPHDQLPAIPHEQFPFIPREQLLPPVLHEQHNHLYPLPPHEQAASHSSASLSDKSLPESHYESRQDHVALAENQDVAFGPSYQPSYINNNKLDTAEEEALSKDGPKKLPFFKIVDGIPVQKNGLPCAAWKGYGVLDQLENTRPLTCLIEIEEWVHLVGNVVKLYDQYGNFNGELEKEDYILYRKDRKEYARLKKKMFKEEPVKRSPARCPA